MKKIFIYSAAALMIIAASCKENVSPIDMTDGALAEDSTYVDAVATPESKRILIEELSGVECVNCPQGAEELEKLSNQNSGLLSIVTVHTGDLTNPIPGKSTQNFTIEEGKRLQTLWGGQGDKPTAIFDRLPIGTGAKKFFINSYTGWANALVQAKAAHSTTPVNISVESSYNDKKEQFDIKVIVKYTQAVTGKQALNIFVTESKIIDVQEYAPGNYDMNYEFNHIMRKAITAVGTGRPILDSLNTKEAGRVYVHRTALKIDKSNEKQSKWKPENMTVVAFVTNVSTDDIHVIHVQETKLQ